jgi:hypothetical protein
VIGEFSSKSMTALSGNPYMKDCRVRRFCGEVLSMAAGSTSLPVTILNVEPVVRSVENVDVRYGLAILLGDIASIEGIEIDAH